MQIASSIATKDFAGYFEQAVFQPALHSRILQKKGRTYTCKPFYNSEL